MLSKEIRSETTEADDEYEEFIANDNSDEKTRWKIYQIKDKARKRAKAVIESTKILKKREKMPSV